ncbi:hypothetical protein O2W18_21025 [Modestobacter sp. VKM Ac-2983]|uniref:hypothetical protein n=1 Tax=Modestobacter sp. VKM Ac-2983 TaxID=3004137 RepID=UPI0022AB5975|nr:hypothetical protein [Modestobacter sp. VKM Ac-2983]MCZ2807596.1 hypothetical protein [Modestobacter sp. VKM Ac-2983]
MTLQIVGTLAAGWALRDNLRTYGDGRGMIPAASRALEWMQHQLGRRTAGTAVAKGSATGSWTFSGTPVGEAPVAEDAPVPEQLQFLRRRVSYLLDDVADVRKDLGQVQREITQMVSEAIAEARAREAELSADLARVAAGSARLELFGLFLVVVGTAVSALG